MESVAALKNPGSKNNKHDGAISATGRSYDTKTNFNPAIVKMVADGGENFFRYLKKMNLSKEADILVLPSKEHYYYEEKEIKQFKTIVNLKKLNNIKHPGRFLDTLVCILPENVNYVGCFSEDKTMNGDSFSLMKLSGLFRRFINFLDSRTDNTMNRKEVSELLVKHGFEVINMTEINGLIYFYSQNVSREVELMAS